MINKTVVRFLAFRANDFFLFGDLFLDEFVRDK